MVLNEPHFGLQVNYPRFILRQINGVIRQAVVHIHSELGLGFVA